MKLSYLVPALFGLLTLASPVFSQTTPGTKRVPANNSRVLLLDNFQIVEGICMQESNGDYSVINGSERKVYPAKQVLILCESRDDVQRYLMSRAKASDQLPPPPLVAKATDFNSAAVKSFPTRIEPVLSNLCASCHSKPDHTSRFKLMRIMNGYANADATLKNLHVTVAFIRRNDPSASDLLMKAVTAHGGQQAPAIQLRSHPAFQNLELWVHWATMPEGSPMPLVVPARPKPRPEAVFVSQPAAKPVSKPLPRAATPVAVDPYDPNLFNRMSQAK